MPDLTYRFRGRVSPENVERLSVRAEVPAADLADGVAKMRLYDPIDSWGGEWGVSAKEFTAALDALPEGTNSIELHVNSPGGEVFQGLAILNSLRNHPAKVTVIVDGIAASAASFIAVGADELVMGRNAELMIHDAFGISLGNAKDMRDMADMLDHISNNIASVYADKSGGTTEQWREAMLAETWYSADEAVAAGLSDRVAAKVDQAPTDRFDLSAFNYEGRAKAPSPKLDTDEPAVDTTALAETTDRQLRLQQRRVARAQRRISAA